MILENTSQLWSLLCFGPEALWHFGPYLRDYGGDVALLFE